MAMPPRSGRKSLSTGIRRHLTPVMDIRSERQFAA